MKKAKKCGYGYAECRLRENNNGYILQFVYLLPATLVFILDIRQFTFFAIILYTAPIIIDTWCADSINSKLNVCIKLFFWINLIIAIVCVVGLAGIIKDDGAYFIIGDFAAGFSGAQIDKRLCAKLFLFELIAPVMFYIGCPCKKNMDSKKNIKEILAANHIK
ncbi:MAG: hypothetical protein LKK00_05490 [Intestinimonas sp.]|nr:hypothetical protein [Intestinimonas sp.]